MDRIKSRFEIMEANISVMEGKATETLSREIQKEKDWKKKKTGRNKQSFNEQQDNARRPIIHATEVPKRREVDRKITEEIMKKFWNLMETINPGIQESHRTPTTRHMRKPSPDTEGRVEEGERGRIAGSGHSWWLGRVTMLCGTGGWPHWTINKWILQKREFVSTFFYWCIIVACNKRTCYIFVHAYKITI